MNGRPEGDLLPYEQVWELSKLWYRDRLSPDFSGRSVEEAHAIFSQVGLTTPFWRFDARD